VSAFTTSLANGATSPPTIARARRVAAGTRPAGIIQMVAWAFSLAAAGLFAPLVLGIWWKRTTSMGAIIGMMSGFGVCLFYLIATRYFDMPLWFGIRNISSALFGMPVAFIVTWAVSLMTTPPSKEMQDFVDSIRTPKGDLAWVSLTAWPVVDTAAGVIRYEGALQDISGRRKAERVGPGASAIAAG